MTENKKLTRVFDKRIVKFVGDELNPNEKGQDKLNPDLLNTTGIFSPDEFVAYGIYNGGDETEYLCEVFSLDDKMPIHTEKELEDLRNDVINAASLSQDGFVSMRIMRYDFTQKDINEVWQEAPEHYGQTSSSDYYFYDSNDSFLTILAEEVNRRKEEQNSQTHDSNSPDFAPGS